MLLINSGSRSNERLLPIWSVSGMANLQYSREECQVADRSPVTFIIRTSGEYGQMDKPEFIDQARTMQPDYDGENISTVRIYRTELEWNKPLRLQYRLGRF